MSRDIGFFFWKRFRRMRRKCAIFSMRGSTAEVSGVGVGSVGTSGVETAASAGSAAGEDVKEVDVFLVLWFGVHVYSSSPTIGVVADSGSVVSAKNSSVVLPWCSS